MRATYLEFESAAYFNICATADFICSTISPSLTEIEENIINYIIV